MIPDIVFIPALIVLVLGFALAVISDIRNGKRYGFGAYLIWLMALIIEVFGLAQETPMAMFACLILGGLIAISSFMFTRRET